MKISCQSCQAKYTIADEKVVGKLVKIRCKKCSATIVVNGNELAAGGGAGGDAGQAVDWAQGAGESWTVNVADGDQRTMTAQEIADAFRQGVIVDETYCWRDGMADWLPLREIEPLWSLANAGPRPSLDFEDHGAPASMRPPAAEQPSPAAPLFGATEPAGGGYGGASAFGATEPVAAARRTGGRAQGADLFAGGAEDDGVMTSAAAGMPAGGGGLEGVGEVKLTGARNENSVLFSLSALTNDPKKAPEPEPKAVMGGASAGTTEGSGLIDIRQLAKSISDKDGRGPQASRVDDIMNLSGGGAFGAALAAPILAPPPLEVVGASDAGGQQKGNKALIFAILGGCAILGIAIVAAVALTRSDDPKAEGGDKGAPTASAVALNTAPTTADPVPTPPSGTDTGSSGGTVAPPPTGANTAKAAPAGGGGGGGGTRVASGGGGGGTKSEPAAAPAPAPAQPKSLAEAMAQSASSSGGPAKASGGGGAAQPFDRGAAAGALSGVNVQSCKKPDGPTGSGHVYVTFQPDGNVQKVEVDAAPYAGTPVGACVAGKFRGAHVPAFSGGPVRVGKSFTIN